jgi:hypothetical protein
MRVMAMVLVVAGLLITAGTGFTCPSGKGKHLDRFPVTLFEHCLEKDMQAGVVQHVNVTERDVRWFVKGSPEIRVERVRLAEDEVSRLRSLSARLTGCPARHFTISVARATPRPAKAASQFAGSLASLALALAVFVWSVRRGRSRVRVLTRQVERREAYVLAYTTLAVAAFIWATWPDREASTVERLQQRVRANLVHDVTFQEGAVAWKELGRRTTFSAPVGASEMRGLSRSIRGAIVHTRNPDRPSEVLHRVGVRRETASMSFVLNLIPWLIAGALWCFWVRLIRKSCCW